MRTRFDTDLTDTQWDLVYRTVLAPGGYPESVRDVVDGIRYRERACVGWWLLPPGFPSAETLEGHRTRWVKDGLWADIRQAADSLERDVSDPLAGARLPLRRRAARAVRGVPGSSVGLAVARLPIQTAQFGYRLLSAHHRWLRRLYAEIRRGDQALADSRYRAAVTAYTRALDLAPGHPHPLLGRATAQFGMAQYAETIEDSAATLAARLATPDHRARAHALTARALALSGGDLERATRHQTEVWWAYDRDRPGGADGIGPIARLDALMSAHDDLAEYLINNYMAFDTALALYRRKPAVRAEYVAGFGDHVNVSGLILSEDWVRNIGHTAYLDTFAKMRAMGWANWDRMVLLAPPAATANSHYARYWEHLYDVVTDARLADAIRPAARAVGPRVAGLLRFPDGSERYFTEALGTVQQAWEAEDRPPLLALTPDDREHGRQALEKLGVPDGAWFVCLHVREPGYHKEGDNPHQRHRNADIRTYLPAVEEVVRRGGWVVRLGDRSMTPLPNLPGLVDYAHSPLKSARLDVILSGGCRFYIGVASGLCHIPTTFGRPCVLTNWVSNALPVYSRYDLFLPKLMSSVRTGRPLGFAEMYSPVPRQAAYSGVFLTEHGLKVVDNTAAEIRAVVTEMLDQLDGRADYTPGDQARQARFAATLARYEIAGACRIGRDFLRSHASLLPATPAIPAAA